MDIIGTKLGKLFTPDFLKSEEGLGYLKRIVQAAVSTDPENEIKEFKKFELMELQYDFQDDSAHIIALADETLVNVNLNTKPPKEDN